MRLFALNCYQKVRVIKHVFPCMEAGVRQSAGAEVSYGLNVTRAFGRGPMSGGSEWEDVSARGLLLTE